MVLKLDMHNHLDTLESLKKSRDIFDVSTTSSISDFYVISQFMATTSVINCVGTLDFHIKYVF